MKKLIVFLFFFSMDVRVRAEDFVSVFFKPQSCLTESEYCVIKNYKLSKYTFEINQTHFGINHDTIFIRHSPTEYTLTQGEVLITTPKKVVLNTPYGKIEVTPDSEVLIKRVESEYAITVLQGKILLLPLGDTSSVEVLAAYENTLSGVQNLKAQVGIPKPALIEETLKKWVHLTYKNKKEFLKSVDIFKEEHSQASHQLSILSREIAMREVEQNEERLQKEKKMREHNELYESQIREKNKKRLLLLEE